MKLKDRVQNIQTFVQEQRYLLGLNFRVIPEPDDKFIIEFEEANQRQLSTLNHRLMNAGMDHIRARALKINKYDNPKKKKNGIQKRR